jgi:tungstate transport system substrate-binding protein
MTFPACRNGRPTQGGPLRSSRWRRYRLLEANTPSAGARQQLDIAKEQGAWYWSIGQGMGAALNMASASNAYVLSDRGTWLAFKNRGDLVITVEGDKRLFNQYGVMLVNPAKHPNVKAAFGQQFIDWLISPEGQTVIGGYKINGRTLFYPNADDPNG